MSITILQLERIPIYPPTNGRENRVWETAKALSSMGDVHIASPKTNETPHERDGIKFIDTNNILLASKFRSIHLWNTFQLVDYLNPFDSLQSRQTVESIQKRNIRPDLVVVESPQLSTAAIRLGQLYDVPVLLNKHNASYMILKRFLESSPLPDLIVDRAVNNLKKFENYAIESADAVVFQSEADIEQFEIPPDILVKIIPNGTDVSSIQQGGNPGAVADELDLRLEENVCIFVGSYDYIANRKAAEFITEEIAPMMPETQFVLAGRNPPEVVGSNVHTPGFVDDLPGLLQLSDIGLCPIIIGSGTNLKILDYIAAGLPIISTELATVGIDIEDKKSVIIAQTAEEFVQAISKIQSNPALQSEMRKNSIALSHSYDWDVLMSEYEPLVKDLLDRDSL